MTWKDRERAFYLGAPLAIIPALGFLPTFVFLVVNPIIAHAWIIAAIVLPAFALVSSFGLWKLATGAVQRPFGILNALSVGALLVLLVIAAYTGLFLAVLTLKL